MTEMLRAADYYVAPCALGAARIFVSAYHYAKSGSNTAVYVHGLFRAIDDELCGVAWWLPPTRVTCESVDRQRWKQVLSLTRMVVAPGVPKNACSFLLARSVRLIRKEKRFVALVTYADESQGHEGGVYRAANWTYAGRTGPYPRWVTSDGTQVARQSTKSRTAAEMLSLGHVRAGSFHKHKFVLRLD